MSTRSPKHPSFLVLIFVAVACNGEDSTGNASSTGNGRSDSGAPSADASARGGDSSAPLAAFDGSCSTTQWAAVSHACWTCMCDACADTLNACDENCMSVLACTLNNHTLVNVAADLSCEVTATVKTCLTDATSQAAAGAITNLDGCLIGKATAPQFRHCEDVCGIEYPGDVCQRFPPGM